jgi:hypothetical protein
VSVFVWPEVRGLSPWPEIDEIAPEHPTMRRRHILPGTGGVTRPSSLLMWWMLLYGLSSVARYEPEVWVDALDVDNSPLAVPLEQALETAVDVVPALIRDALVAPATIARGAQAGTTSH